MNERQPVVIDLARKLAERREREEAELELAVIRRWELEFEIDKTAKAPTEWPAGREVSMAFVNVTDTPELSARPEFSISRDGAARPIPKLPTLVGYWIGPTTQVEVATIEWGATVLCDPPKPNEQKASFGFGDLVGGFDIPNNG